MKADSLVESSEQIDPVHGFELQKIAPTREERLFLVLSIFIGVLSGLLVVSFRVAIEWIRILTLGSAPHPGQYRLLLAPALAGLGVALLVRWLFPGAVGSGVNQTKAALYIYNGYISFRTVIGKFVTSAIAIGSGHSLGPEDPSLQIGAGVASMVARRLRLLPAESATIRADRSGGRLGSGIQRSHICNPVCYRGGHRPMERGRSGFRSAVCDLQRCGCTVVLGF